MTEAANREDTGLMTVVAVDDPKGMVTNADVRAEEAEVEGAKYPRRMRR